MPTPLSNSTPITHYLSDYAALPFTIESVYLTFYLNAHRTRVINEMHVSRIGSKNVSMVLNGENLVLISLTVDGVRLTQTDYRLNDEELVLTLSQPAVKIVIETEIDPENNTRLDGLYRTSGNYCTQCEALGFRNITYYVDRPDCMSSFTTKVVANKAENPVLLSNGNLIESGDLDDGQHFAIWQDPHLKPCYLFALVAGNLAFVQDSYVTQEGRTVDLRIYVEQRNIDKCEHAMISLKKSMKWDEDRFGLNYDLDIYMIVAVDDFNMGAMENKGLNVFNSKFVLAKSETATDVDFEGIEAVIGHEYFHNWTGNRVTCRDWFQLTLKEGLTVFRDQEFTADMLSPAVKRIEDVKGLRNHQFSEDSGPLSHPIQPQSYIEMNNFYTMTVYEKGAEVVRMYQTLLGRDGFRKGMDLYIARHDGQAVTVQDFRQAMADANDTDLSQMHEWYVQPGTPHVKVKEQYENGSLTLTLTQFNGDTELNPLLIPILIGFVDKTGQALYPTASASSTANVVQEQERGDTLLLLSERTQSFVFDGFSAQPVVSWLRHFSAPIKLETEQSLASLGVLAKYDTNTFVRWESLQTLAMNSLKNAITAIEQNQKVCLLPEFATAFSATLKEAGLDPALKSLALILPDLTYLGEQYATVPVDSMIVARKQTLALLAQDNEAFLLETYQSLLTDKPYRYAKDDIANRKLQNVCLAYLMQMDAHQHLAVKQYQQTLNMTDVLAALSLLVQFSHAESANCLANFYETWKGDTLVLDKWFSLQAAAQHDQSVTCVHALIAHTDFTYKTPNRVRSVVGVFSRLNMQGFHQIDGAGYQLLVDQVLILDGLNPQVAARMVTPLTQWARYDDTRQGLMKEALSQLLKKPGGLSKDVFEIVSKA